MGKIQDLINKIEKFEKSTDQIIIDILKTDPVKIKALNTNQMSKGTRADGQQILPPYTAYTKRLKRAKGQPISKVTLRDTGDFYGSVSVEFRSNEFELIADDPKTQKLQRKYGQQILGLTNNSLKILIDDTKPKLIDEAKKILL